jgi:monofunctional biosynthetic peptidoglycan transglycosylase
VFLALLPVLVGVGVVLGMGVQVFALRSGPPEVTAFQAATGDGSVRKRWRPLARIDLDVLHAVLASEDARFLDHGGFDAKEIGHAVRDAATELEAPRGASTLTQQLAKNVFLSPDRTLRRKALEAVYAVWMELLLGKRRILELYLNEVELGRGVYGVEAAAQAHFGHGAGELSEREAAELAATLPAPRRSNPSRRTPGFERRVERVLRRMREDAALRGRLAKLVASGR